MAAVVVAWPDDDGDSDSSIPENTSGGWGLAVAPVAIAIGGAAGWLVWESPFDD